MITEKEKQKSSLKFIIPMGFILLSGLLMYVLLPEPKAVFYYIAGLFVGGGGVGLMLRVMMHKYLKDEWYQDKTEAKDESNHV